MTKFFSFLSIVLFISCGKTETALKTDIKLKEKKSSKISSRALPLFDFDEVIHYHKSITLEEWLTIVKKEETQTLDEKKLLNLLNDYLPEKSLNDKILINDIEKLYPEKKEINKSKFTILSNVYSEKFYDDYALAACEPYYRDILVFKNQHKIIGISKVCFDCNLHSTIGTKRNSEQLGQNGDYAKLKDLLK